MTKTKSKSEIDAAQESLDKLIELESREVSEGEGFRAAISKLAKSFLSLNETDANQLDGLNEKLLKSDQRLSNIREAIDQAERDVQTAAANARAKIAAEKEKVRKINLDRSTDLAADVAQIALELGDAFQRLSDSLPAATETTRFDEHRVNPFQAAWFQTELSGLLASVGFAGLFPDMTEAVRANGAVFAERFKAHAEMVAGYPVVAPPVPAAGQIKNPTYGYKAAGDSYITDVFEGALPAGWVDSPAKVH